MQKAYFLQKKLLASFFVFVLFHFAAQAQEVVTGTVVAEEDGEALPGVSVLVKGTQRGTVTDIDGEFSIEASEGEILSFSYIGYTNRDFALEGGMTNIEVALSSSMGDLGEVVVVGYGTQRSQDLTGSVGVVPMKNIQDLPVAGLDMALTGQVAGVQINTSNGVPGGGPDIQVRGVGAVGAGSQPLYVVDGFPLPTTTNQTSNPINDIPPQDIESISILKDASATAIYGSRGANGVVIITTKRGADGKVNVQVGANTGVQAIPQQGRPDLMNASEFAQWRNNAISDRIRYEEGREPTLNDIPEEYRDPASLGEGTNWFDEISRVAPMSDLNVSISGGNENINTYVSAGYFNQDGVVIGTGFERFSLRANVNANLTDKLSVGINLAPTFTNRERAITGGAGRGEQGFGEAMVASPLAPVYLPDGSFNPMIQSPGTFDYPNPVMNLTQTDDQTNQTRMLINAFLEYEITPDLRFKTTFNTDMQNSRREFYRPTFIGELNFPPPTVGTAQLTEMGYFNWLNENTLNYDKTFGDHHHFSALAGFTIQKQTNHFSTFTGEQFPDDDVRMFNAAARIVGDSDRQEWSLISYLARVNYAYMDKYLFTGTVRRDGSSRFGRDNRWGVFPSMALGWRLSEEGFMRDNDWVSDLKLRASYGVSGNFEIGNYTHLSQIVDSDYVFGGGLAGGRRMGNLGNPNLGWERMTEINFGVDFGILDDRIVFTADIYQRNTRDLLLSVEIPHSSGFGEVTENRGDVQNRGIEFAFTSRNIVSSDFDWTTNFNIAVNRNKVLALGRTNEPILTGLSGEGNPTNITMVGRPLGLFFGYVFDGIYESQEEIDAGPAFPGAVPGNMRVRDIDGDGVINPVSDFDVIGDPYPHFTWGMTNTLTYRNWDMRVLITGAMGADRLRTQNEYLWNIDGVFNVTRNILEGWRSPENPGSGTVPTTTGSGRGRVMFRDVNSLWVERADYLWVRNITLGYTFPEGIGKFIRSARFYSSIQNPILFTTYPGNPEVANYGNTGVRAGALVPGVDYSSYPVPQIFTIGTNITF
jgi:TonB-dependent starch-binding outer membrane protein SusC